MKNKNSNKIISAIKQNHDKFKIISDMSSKYISKLEEKEKVVQEIGKRCSMLKNLVTKKNYIGKINNTLYYLSPVGITKKYKDFSIGIELTKDRTFNVNELCLISRMPGIRKCIKKNENKKRFDKFFDNKKFKLLYNEPSTKIQLKKDINVYVHSSIPSLPLVYINNSVVYVNNFSLESYGKEFVILLKNKEDKIVIDINTRIIALKEKIYIEQTFTYIKDLLKREIKNREKEIERFKLFIKKLKEDMPEYFLLEAIEE